MTREDELDRSMADFEAQVARAGQVRAAMTQVQGHGRNQDGSVTVTVAPSGRCSGCA